MDNSKTIQVILTVVFQTEDGSPCDCDLEEDLRTALEYRIERGLLTDGHDELIISEYKIETNEV